MSALPYITPRNNEYVTASYAGTYQTWPKRLPSAPDIPTRTNPLKPPPPARRRKVDLETGEPHFLNQERSMRMRQREHYRYHNAWSKYYYGSPADQEAHRAHTRVVLKQQMADQDTHKRKQLKEKVQESMHAVEYDRQCRMDDFKKFQNNLSHLMTFRDENKALMEKKWTTHKVNRVEENKFDREQLRYNPINWSCTLK